MTDVKIRPAETGDNEHLVDFALIAGDGLPERTWAQMALPGETPRDVGLRRVAGGEGSFSWRNGWLAEQGGRVVGGMIGYALGSEPVEIGPDFPAPFVPLQELENMVPSTWYLNILAVYPDLRGAGVGLALLDHAGELARDQGLAGVSIIVFAANPGAERLYRRAGFGEVARRPVPMPGWQHDGTEAILLVKPV